MGALSTRVHRIMPLPLLALPDDVIRSIIQHVARTSRRHLALLAQANPCLAQLVVTTPVLSTLLQLPECALVAIVKHIQYTDRGQLVVLAQANTSCAQLVFRNIGGWGSSGWISALRDWRGDMGPWLGWLRIPPPLRRYWH